MGANCASRKGLSQNAHNVGEPADIRRQVAGFSFVRGLPPAAIKASLVHRRAHRLASAEDRIVPPRSAYAAAKHQG